jgi:CMP-N-acetylneuraminic acid synthetase
MTCIAVIPARGGSKGIPRKNLQKVGGIPLVVRAVNSCLEARSIERVVVSTDDQEIAEVSRSCGAEVIVRPAELADDVIMPDASVVHAIDTLWQEESYEPEDVFLLQCTSPLTTFQDLDCAYRKFAENKADSLLAVTPSHMFLWKNCDGVDLAAINHDSSVRIARQEIIDEYRETGAFYLMRVSGFMETHHRFFGRIVGYEIPSNRSIDIDDFSDLKLANLMLESSEECL